MPLNGRFALLDATTTLDKMPCGACGTVASAAEVPADAELLRAMGLREGLSIRICRAGEPCIVEVDGTRLGIAREMSAGVQVAAIATA